MLALEGEKHGILYAPDLSPEAVRDHLDAIRDQAGYTVPRHTSDESDVVFGLLASALG